MMVQRQARRILLGVSGGIAAYKIPELVRMLIKEGCDVRVILTPSAEKFVTVETLQTLSGNPVYTGVFEPVFLERGHTELARWADLFCVAPVTANTLAKLALGAADNLLTTTWLAATCPKLLVPAMNTEMLGAAATQRNIETLRRHGVFILPTDVGELACKTVGPGRLPELEIILEAILKLSGTRSLVGKDIVISAGATQEAIDDVRVITNRSSGRMGIELAREAARRGGDVTLLLGHSDVEPPAGIRVERAQSVEELGGLYRKHAAHADIFIAAAAVGDYLPERQEGKLKRGGDLHLDMHAAPDLIASIAQQRARSQVLIGFALEPSASDEPAALKKLKEKNLDAIFLNSIDAMGAEGAGGVGLTRTGVRHAFEAKPKSELAADFWNWAETIK